MRNPGSLQQSQIKNILVIRPWSVAEILSATPLVRILHNCFPEARIDFLLEKKYKGLITGCPFINNFITCDSLNWKQTIAKIGWISRKRKRERYNLVIDLQGEFKSGLLTFFSLARFRVGYRAGGWRNKFYNITKEASPVKKHLVLSYLDLIKDLINCGGNPLNLKLFVARPDIHQKEMYFQNLGDENKKKILIHPGGERLAKLWPDDKFAQLADRLLQDSHNKVNIILAGADKGVERRRVEEINRLIYGRGYVVYHSGLSQLISLTDGIDILVGHDDSPMHIAAALGKNVVALFGPSDPRIRHPWGSGHEVLWPRLPCSPCELYECFKEKAGCMAQIEVAQVMEAVNRFLN